MRTIKFRGKDVYGKWLYGSLCVHSDQTASIQSDGLWRAVETDTVGQFTGVPDVDGKNIFEGDILLSKYGHPYSVYWDSHKLRFTLGNAVNEQLGIQFVKDYGLRVIGNVHDNPTLIADICSNKTTPNF
jgi:hypothetical protein